MILLLFGVYVNSLYTFRYLGYSEYHFYNHIYTLNLQEKDWHFLLNSIYINKVTGIRKIYFMKDSTNLFDRVILGDIEELRGIFLSKNISKYTISTLFGKYRDKIFRVLPTYNSNDFFIKLGVDCNNKGFYSVVRKDKSPYSPSHYNFFLRGYFPFLRGNLKSYNSFGVGTYGTPGFEIFEHITYKRKSFFSQFYLRTKSTGFVDERNNYIEMGRLDLSTLMAYRFPFGMGLKSGIGMNGFIIGDRKKRISFGTSYRFKNGLSTTFSTQLSFFDFNNREIERTIRTRAPYRNFTFTFYYRYYQKNQINEEISTGLMYFFNPNFYIYLNAGRRNGKQNFVLSSINIPLTPKLKLNANLIYNGGNPVMGVRIFFNPYNTTSISVNYGINTFDYSKNFEASIANYGEIKNIGLSSISGVVFIDKNSNGRFDKEDEPVKDIKVVLDGKKNYITNKSGKYRFLFIPGGKHNISVGIGRLPAYVGLTKKSISIVTGGTKRVHVNIPIVGLSSISGKIFFDKNRNSSFDRGENGVPNIIVKLKGTDLFTVTDRKGNYIIDNVPPGIYMIQLKNLPPGFSIFPYDLIPYVLLKPIRPQRNVNIGISQKQKTIRKKIFKD